MTQTRGTRSYTERVAARYRFCSHCDLPLPIGEPYICVNIIVSRNKFVTHHLHPHCTEAYKAANP